MKDIKVNKEFGMISFLLLQNNHSVEEMYDVLLKYQSKHMEEKLEQKFFGISMKSHSA